ncbi:MAG TPA: class I adenylate-forming enzyme family protein, partial [Actinomycetota bacterium]|nr:class I adenylate-forming enzyme family protein [Actinomycetota bacterium]
MEGQVAINYAQPAWRERRRVFIRERDHLNYATFIDRICGLYGERTAFLLDRPLAYPGFSGDTMSFNDVARIVNRMAGALRALGVSKGDRVGLITMNRIEMAFCNFACGKIGALPVPMNFMLRPNEIEHIVQKAGIELVVADPLVWTNTIKDPSSVPSVKRWAMIGDQSPSDGVTALADAMRDVPDYIDPVQPSSDDDIALLFFTSGTTGFPKGAMLSHAAAMIGLRQHCKWASFAPRITDRLALLVMPVAHAAGYATMMLNLGLGTPAYFVSKFDTNVIFDKVEELGPTVFAGTPAMYRMLLAAGAARRNWRSVRVFGGGADAFDDELVRAVRNLARMRGRFGKGKLPWFIRGYGMAEANSYLAQTPPFEAGDNCCGWVMPPVKYRLVDEDGNDVRPGEAGELWIKGPNVTTGYWNDPEATAQAFSEDGWYRTGDILRRGKWRMLYFVGRSSDIIKSGGYK